MQTLLKPIRVCVADPQPIMRSALKACLRTTEGIHVTELLGSWAELAQYLQTQSADVVIIDQSLLNLAELPHLQRQSSAAWLVLTHHQAQAEDLKASGQFQALLNKDAGVTELTRTVQGLVKPSGPSPEAKIPVVAPAKKTKRAKMSAPKPTKALAGKALAENTPQLTPREQEVATLMAQGLSLEAIAKTMGVQLKTVKTYQTKLKKKNQVSS
ncbi:MAG: response regulator transcription factor [Candidatus Sericytochromatia bacterium]|nr:response regulator transcription factor [Candidatus Sericytochromatia bacterium]